MTDEQIILILAKKVGMRILSNEEMRAEAGKVWIGQSDTRIFLRGFSAWPGKVIGDEIMVAQDFPPWLSSKDTLAPVVENLNHSERIRLVSRLCGRTPDLVMFSLLTVTPRDLAYAIAQAIEEK